MSRFAIVGIGTCLPEKEVTVSAVASGQDATILQTRVGFERKHVPERDVSPWRLAVDAGQLALKDARLRPGDVDQVLHVGRMRVDYFTWGLSLAIMNELGMKEGNALDLTEFTGPNLLAGLRILAAKFKLDDRRKATLMTFPHRFSDFVDPTIPRDRWLAPLGDGGAALVVKRDAPGIVPLGHAFWSGGSGGRGIGLRTEVVDEGPTPDDFFQHEWALAKYYFLRDPDAWYAQYKATIVAKLAHVIQEAAARSSLPLDQVPLVQCGYLYPEIAEGVRAELGLGKRLRAFNSHGIMAGTELAFALQVMRADRALQGQRVILAGAGLPAHAGAMALQF
jgi:3-oxoacyl-[acyl-carrier-protein] synthase III